MAALGRWAQVDPLADEYAGYSPYNYVLGNPNSLIDPDGREPTVAAIVGGAAVGVGITVLQDLAMHGRTTPRRMLVGGVTGALAVATSGFSTGQRLIVGAVGGILNAGTAAREFEGSVELEDLALGAVSGLIGEGLGNRVAALMGRYFNSLSHNAKIAYLTGRISQLEDQMAAGDWTTADGFRSASAVVAGYRATLGGLQAGQEAFDAAHAGLEAAVEAASESMGAEVLRQTGEVLDRSPIPSR